MLEFTAVQPLSVDEFSDLCDDFSGLFCYHFFASGVSEIHLLCMCNGCRNKTKIIDGQPMQRNSECGLRFVHVGRSFISPAMYKIALAKRIAFCVPVLSVNPFPQYVY